MDVMKRVGTRTSILLMLLEFIFVVFTALSVVTGIYYAINGEVSIIYLMINLISAAIVFALIIVANNFASKDLMTGIANRESFVMSLYMLKRSKNFAQYSSVFVNIRDFKYINRIAGSTGGDEALIQFSKQLTEKVGKDGKVARLGGDNFILYIKNDKLDALLKHLENVTLVIKVSGQTLCIPVKTRCGFYHFQNDDAPSDIMNKTSMVSNIARARKSLAPLEYNPSFSDSLYEAQEVSFNFEHSLNRGEFIVYYQPKVDSTTNTIVGAEALARWKRNGDLIPPGAFIPILESSGLITKLDFYIYEETIKNLIKWQEMGLKTVPVSTNFSKANFSSSTFAEDIIAIANKYDFDRDLIRVEVTESVDIKDKSFFIEFLRKLHEANIKVSIDDFGVGYSSLELLATPYVHCIKIDKTFVDHI